MCKRVKSNLIQIGHFLQEFHCERSDEGGLTLTSLAMLLGGCPRLTAVSDIQAWRGIEPAEVRLNSLCEKLGE